MDIPTGIRRRQSIKKSSKSRLPSATSDAEAEHEDHSDLATRPYSSPKLRTIFLLCIALRAALALFGQKTFFQPDEFYQSLEPAHRLVWGTGFETWEWRGGSGEGIADLETQMPTAKSVNGNQILPVHPTNTMAGAANDSEKSGLQRRILESPFWSQFLLRRVSRNTASGGTSAPERVDGMLRSWVWPLIFALPYWLLKVLRLDQYGPFLVLAPRLPMVLLAALTDFYTYRLAGRVLGKCYREAALFLSLTNLFHAHVLTRTLTTSAETCLTVMALYYWPLPLSDESSRWVSEGSTPNKAIQQSSVISGKQSQTTPDVKTKDDQDEDNLNLSLALSAAAFVLRPTNIVLWSFLGLELCVRCWRSTRKFQNVVKLAVRAIIIGYHERGINLGIG
ncbi:hypothetical protein QFC22_000200 [Naganishia vaughanmartiniae]|uniref:Uncharacterized protein n=1 Tax=Naganishia vaughanmartiniae TaxID=1424756 RepID=A0ACC2XMF6_9TREE|nr:hypothetical protein QFC22_000200 [Naganishia vaughanmartiniae]